MTITNAINCMNGTLGIMPSGFTCADVRFLANKWNVTWLTSHNEVAKSAAVKSAEELYQKATEFTRALLSQDYTQIVNNVVVKGMNPITSCGTSSCLVSTITTNRTKSAELLLDLKADPDKRYSAGSSGEYLPIFEAVTHGLVNMVDLLDRYKANFDILNRRGEPAIAVAARKGNLPVVKRMTRINLDINQRSNTDQWTALHQALWNKHFDVAELLLKHDADPCSPSYVVGTPYDVAKKVSNDPEVLKLFVCKKGAKSSDNYNSTACDELARQAQELQKQARLLLQQAETCRAS